MPAQIQSNYLTSNYKEVMDYAQSIVEGRKIACPEIIQGVNRFLNDLKNPAYDFRVKDAEFVINIIESTFVHRQGEDMQGRPLLGRPFLLEPFHKFQIYNILGFFHKGTRLRRFKEVFIFIPRKNIKTTFIAALAWAIGLLERMSGSKVYITAAALKQSLESFDFIHFNIKEMGESKNWRIIDNNQEHSLQSKFKQGSLFIQALAANPDAQDSFNCNIGIADEIHAYTKPKQYTLIKDAMKAYSNRLMIGITTAGDNMNSFCYRKLVYCKKILDGTIVDETYFVFIAKAPEAKNGDVDFLNPNVHEMANPAYGVSIRPADIMADAIQAQNDPQLRKDFLAKSLNVYTAAMKAYFDIDEFRASDRQYSWTIQELAALDIDWYGGADLSKMHDLTAGALYGTIKNYYTDKDGIAHDVDIVITHAWFPIIAATAKAEEDSIPLFGWKDDGWLDMCNTPTVNYSDIVNWFIKMRNMGFKIKQVGFDRKFSKEFFNEMKKARFNMFDEPQTYTNKSEGFRHIEKKAKDGDLYYLHSDAYEYCIQNVHAIEKTDDMMQYEKIQPQDRIDLFDASVFSCVRKLNDLQKSGTATAWLKGK